MSLLFNMLSQWIWVILGLTFLMSPHFLMTHFVTSGSSSHWLHFIARDLVPVWLALWHLLLWDWDCDLALISAFVFPSILSFFLHWFSIYQNYPAIRHWPSTVPEWMQSHPWSFLSCLLPHVDLCSALKLLRDSVLSYRFNDNCSHSFKEALRLIAGWLANVCW